MCAAARGPRGVGWRAVRTLRVSRAQMRACADSRARVADADAPLENVVTAALERAGSRLFHGPATGRDGGEERLAEERAAPRLNSRAPSARAQTGGADTPVEQACTAAAARFSRLWACRPARCGAAVDGAARGKVGA